MQDIILIGGGGHCKSVIDVIEQENKYNILGIVDKKEFIGNEVLGYKIIGSDDELPKILSKCNNAMVTVGHIRDNKVRVKLYEKLKNIGFTLPAIISPLAYVSKHACIDEGTVVMHGSIVNPNVHVGKNCILNTKSLIEHDCVIEDHCHVSTGTILNGAVHVKSNTFYGSNATCKESIVVEGFIKAGSVVK